MKKILIMLFLLFIITGCSDYKELENLASITSIGVDYIDDQFKITYEILDNKKGENDKIGFNSYTVSASGKSVTDAFIKALDQVKLEPYFAHVELFIIDEKTASNHLDELVDFLLRENEIREHFLFVVTNNAEKLLITKNDNVPVTSMTIKKMLEVNELSKNVFKKITFDEFISNIENNNIDNVVPYIEIDDNSLIINKLAYFQKYKMNGVLNDEMGDLYSLFCLKNPKYYIKHYFENQLMEIKVLTSKKDIGFKDNSINIDLKLTGDLINNETNLDLKNIESYKIINKAFEKDLNDKVKSFITYLQNNQIDILGFKKEYYNKTRKKIQNEWANYDINININFNLSRKGIIYDATKNE